MSAIHLQTIDLIHNLDIISQLDAMTPTHTMILTRYNTINLAAIDRLMSILILCDL
jgi:hypothetical protein